MRAPTNFGRSVNPISTRGADYAQHITVAPPDFQTNTKIKISIKFVAFPEYVLIRRGREEGGGDQ